jgi:hypothetical protein
MADTLPDIIAGQLAIVFCGINPGMTAAATGHHFAGRGNRFWRAIHRAGFTPEEIAPENDRTILRHGCRLTTVVERPTAGGSIVGTRIHRRRRAFRAQDCALCAALRRLSRQGGLLRIVRSTRPRLGISAGNPWRRCGVGSAQCQRAQFGVQLRPIGRRLPSTLSGGKPERTFDVEDRIQFIEIKELF